jgi:hypothetical protein
MRSKWRILELAFQHDYLWHLLKMKDHCFYFYCVICVELLYLIVQVTKHFCKFKDSLVWICVVIITLSAMNAIFCSVVLSGNSTYTVVLPLAKGRTLQNGIRALVLLVGSRT